MYLKTQSLGLLLLLLTAGVAVADDHSAEGAAIFKKCMACHAIGEGAKNKIGPQLNDIVGRVAGTAEAYKYSQVMIDAGAGGLVWTPETLSTFLANPKDVVAGTKMTFAGLAEQEDIDKLIAYLLTMSPNYVPDAPAAQ